MLVMSDGRHVLIDSGLPADAPQPPGTQAEEQTNVLTHLAAVGLRPTDIDLLICTFFDPIAS
jgi:hypothetical protein